MKEPMTNKIAKLTHKFVADVCNEMTQRIVSECELSEEQSAKLKEVLSSCLVLEKPDAGVRKVKTKREPTKYNLFMRDAIKRLREENPDMVKTELMKRGAQLWQQQKTHT